MWKCHFASKYINSHVNISIRMRIYESPCECVNLHVKISIHKSAGEHMNSHMNIWIHVWIFSFACENINLHVNIWIRIWKHKSTCEHINSHVKTKIYMWLYEFAYAYINLHVNIWIRKWKHKSAYEHMNSHMNTWIRMWTYQSAKIKVRAPHRSPQIFEHQLIPTDCRNGKSRAAVKARNKTANHWCTGLYIILYDISYHLSNVQQLPRQGTRQIFMNVQGSGFKVQDLGSRI